MTDTNIEKLKQFMYPIVGAIYEVHKELGPGLNEYVYQEALAMQLEEDHIFLKKKESLLPYIMSAQ